MEDDKERLEELKMKRVWQLEIPAIFISLSSLLMYIYSEDPTYFVATLVFSAIVAEYRFDKELEEVRELLSYGNPWDPLEIYVGYILIFVTTLGFLLDGTVITFGVVFMLYCLFVKRMLKKEFSKITKRLEYIKSPKLGQ